MSETPWTPGPWEIDGTGDNGYVEQLRTAALAIDSEDWTVAVIFDDGPPGQANARLIASAPDLAEALQGFLTYHGGHVMTCPELMARMKNGYAAIEKARGESQ